MHSPLPFVDHDDNATPLQLVPMAEVNAWLTAQPEAVREWALTRRFPGHTRVMSYQDGGVTKAVALYENLENPYVAGEIVKKLPQGSYRLAEPLEGAAWDVFCLGWAMQKYEYIRYRAPRKKRSGFVAHPSQRVLDLLESIFLARDLINTPALDMGPEQLEAAARALAETHGARFRSIVGEDLVAQNFAAIHFVGKSAEQAPRFIDLTWGDENHPKLTLVGKGVTFDTGGLNIKTGDLMKLMKKDMGGAAIALGLANLIMRRKLPVRLRVLVGAAENSIDAKSMRPMDIVKTRKGITVEINHTDAEGRVVLSDCLFEGASEKPDLMIDFATLTGAARVAMGTEIAPFFSNRRELHATVMQAADAQFDPMWPMPLFTSYKRFNASDTADLSNEPSAKYGAAISAALFLNEFVDPAVPWIHVDLMAYNAASLPGRPKGGEAQALRAVFHMLEQRYA